MDIATTKLNWPQAVQWKSHTWKSMEPLEEEAYTSTNAMENKENKDFFFFNQEKQ